MNDTIYFIDRSIEKEFETRALDPNEELFFCDLATAYQRGDCYVCGNPASLDILCQKQAGLPQKIYRFIKSRHLEDGAAMNAVQRVFVLTYQKDPNLSSLPEVLQNEGKCHFIHVPTAIKQSWRLFTGCCLLTENLSDIQLYLFIAKYYCLKRHIPYRRINFRRDGGGGSTTCDEFEKYMVYDKMPVLCLVDSDQKHGTTKAFPNKPAIGNTLSNVRKKADTLDAQGVLLPYLLFPLYVHEIENLVPIQLLQKLHQKSIPDMRLGLARVMQLQNIKNGEPVLYYDYKKGFPYIKSAPQRAYWEEILLELGGDSSSMPPRDKPKQDAGCLDNLFFPPLNKNLLDHVLKLIQSAEGDAILQSLQIDNYLKSIWEDIGSQMLTWGYVNEPIRS